MKFRIAYRKLMYVLLVSLMLIGCEKSLDIPPKDSSRVDAIMAEAQEALDSTEEGPEPGLYPLGSKEILMTYIDSARTAIETAETQFKIDMAEIFLQDALDQFLNSVQKEKQLFFDGSGYIDVGKATPFNTAHLTISAWVYPTDVKNGMYIISTEGKKTGYKLHIPNRNPTFQMGVNGESNIKAKSSDKINLDEWTNIAATFDGTSLKLFVNGILKDEADLDYEITDNGENFRIGDGSKFTGRTFVGRISDVRIWDHALSDSEIEASLSNRLTGDEPGLTAWWPFNLSAGNMVLDRTGQHTATLIGVEYVEPVPIPR